MYEPNQQKTPLVNESPLLNRWLGLPWGILFFSFCILNALFGIMSDLSFVFLSVNYYPITHNLSFWLGGFAFFCLFCFVVRKIAQLTGSHFPMGNYQRLKKFLLILALAITAHNWAWVLVPELRTLNMAMHQAKHLRKDPNTWISHSFGNGRFVIQTPAGWRRMDNPNIGPRNIYVVDSLNDLHLIAYSIPKIETSLSKLNEAIQVAVRVQSDQFQNAQAEKTRFSYAGTFPAADCELKVLADGTHLIYQMRVLDCGDCWVELNLWATPSQYAKNETQFMQIRDSLKLVNSAAPLTSNN